MRKIFFIISIASFGILMNACTKRVEPKSNTTNTPIDSVKDTRGAVKIYFRNHVEGRELKLNDSIAYVLPNTEELRIKTFNYYISNIILTDSKGNQFVEEESYHLILANDTTTLHFSVKDIPEGDYEKIQFLIGVDSVRNFSGAQTGALDTKYGMIWSWSTGYIMAKLEGSSPQSSSPDQSVSYHIAGYKGLYSVLQKVELVFPKSLHLGQDHQGALFLNANIARWFDGPNFPGFDKLPNVGIEGINAYKISQNYQNMFGVDSVQNK